ncbi:ATP-binding protein [Chlamydiota bacterium]
MYIPQKQLENLKKLIAPNKVIIVYGARRCGKTTLLEKFTEEKEVIGKYLFINAEDITVKENLESQSIEKLKNFIGNNEYLLIDEAQKINNIGLNLKLIVDNINDIKVIVSGSSSFELGRHTGEPLTGRKFTLVLYPLSQLELKNIEAFHETQSSLENRLLFGAYPEVILDSSNEKRILYLREIVNSYLLKDVLELEGIKKHGMIVKLLQLLCFQVGNEVSLNELGTQLGMSKNTIEKYLDILQDSFIIFQLSGFGKNLRSEVTKTKKYYFYDNGIRNALINNFNPLTMRNDVGQLWENYIIIERLKKQTYENIFSNNYFWRTYSQQEIDWIEEREGCLFAYEIKWSKKEKQPPLQWSKSYKNSPFSLINQQNYLDFIA